jgi:hypothetical protein
MHRIKLSDMLLRVPDADIKRWGAIVKAVSPAPGGPWIVGGAVRRLISETPQTADVDVAFASREQQQAFAQRLLSSGFSKSNDGEHYIGLAGKIDEKETPVQALSVTFGESPEVILDSFDFTICQFAFDGEDIIAGDFSLFDLARKRLAVHRVTFAASSVRRMLKYGRQGYRFCQGTIVSLLDAVSKNPDVIRAETDYVD